MLRSWLWAQVAAEEPAAPSRMNEVSPRLPFGEHRCSFQ